MSTMRVTTLKNESSTVDQIVLNADGSFGGELASTLGSKLNIAGGKILQIVRATDATDRSTSSQTKVDASISVTITPQKSDSAIILIWTFRAVPNSGGYMRFQITDSSNNPISGSSEALFGDQTSLSPASSLCVIGYATPATTSAVTFKGRFDVNTGTGLLGNATQTAQLFAIEVSA